MLVTCAIIQHRNKILITRRPANKSFPLLWEFPGGKCETGESPENALIREIHEELQIEIINLQESEPVYYQSPEISLKLIPFFCSLKSTTSPRPLEHSEIRWVTRNALPHFPWVPPDYPIVLRLQKLIAL